MDRPLMRSPFQGVTNVIRFNWPFYAMAAVATAGLLIAASNVPEWLGTCLELIAAAVLMTTVVSLLVSHSIYDRSDLYRLNWLRSINVEPSAQLISINAGFDETSALLAQAYPQVRLQVFDFYDPTRHTEASIERARRAYASYPGTLPITTNYVPVAAASVDAVLLILAAHEIRNDAERVQFFRELTRTLKPNGQLVVVEHLRDLPNFLAYTVGFLHFHSRQTWLNTFEGAGCVVLNESRITPFVTVFFLTPNGAQP